MPEPLVPTELEAIRRRERRAAAVARTAARVASERSLPATLRALAHEILQADGLAGVQVLTNEHSGDKLHMLGIAGFPTSRGRSFFARLKECEQRGADLRMIEALHTGEPVIIPHRYQAIMNDPAWEPLHDYHRYPEWDAFASVPIKVRQSTIGILNVFVSPGKEIDQEGLEFLLAMAEQAGLAIDYASLLEQERSAAQRQVRQQLARDLHDSVVQQVFSMGMIVQTLKVLSRGEHPQSLQRIQEITEDLEGITGSVLQDLRGLVAQLRPSAISGVGLREALRKLEATTHRQTGVVFDMTVGPVAEELAGELAEDIYHVIAESVHNAVKHSSADLLTISLDQAGLDAIQISVRDNGREPDSVPKGRENPWIEGNGLSFMRQRVERWGGQLDVTLDIGGVGTLVRAEFPYPGADGEPDTEAAHGSAASGA
ncbi:GAF domain-containing sensor histidine kinase [Nesterenkonia flava]|uniref:GAF domain-containing sensor histidine kinase n=1 Tax=Nesterenkonia flava TaxID=469799 RepID=A0ABU1FPL4_9MICC|nr:GAF domain-containing sensor histidine kinase [Nesterenkonia flava]MDR5710589.1 GAF domain-containing sensor histidine kinase [Nesterenkonia flava]